ncbi:MAG: thioredoxin domain-containing protein [Pyrinomonadaceae bacterium]
MFNLISSHLSCRFTIVKLLVLLVIGISFSGTITAAYAQSEEKVVAVVNGRKITQKEIDSSVISQLLPLQQQIYALRKATLENLILRAILEEEARKRGIAVEELRKQLTGGKAEVLTGEVEKLYLENAAVFGSMSPDEAKEKLRLDLESQARIRNYHEALSRLKEKSRIEISLEEPKLLSVMNGDGASSIGSKEAAITITEFSDFQCPYCRGAQGAIKQILSAYGKDVRLVFKHLPLVEIHPQAFASAQAAFCAGEQGFFQPFHDALFAAESLSPETFNKTASALGLNISKFQACLNSENSRAAILKDMQEAKRLGIEGTPTFIINGAVVRGAISFEEFKTIVERELKSAQTAPRRN